MTTKKKNPDAAGAPRSAPRLKTPTAPTESDIASRAYQLFLQRGGEHGHDWEDWLTAERELRPSDR